MSTELKSKSTMEFLLAALFIVYMYFLIRIILFKGAPINLQSLWEQAGRMLEHPDRIFNRPGNYIPFKEISQEMERLSLSDPFSSLNLVGNLLAFIPFGILVPMLFSQKVRLFQRVFILSLALSFCFEFTQLVLYIGTFDVDDLILNTCGGIVGYCIYRLLFSTGLFTTISKRC
ncbi:VanZ family protein [Paenibacillus sp. FSL K6-0276]|uniref:VanZ family protein n=1 Tax=Paenibacillus sp. FSL K6-0276 TaxID=2921450 RepID=UPI0030EDA0E8